MTALQRQAAPGHRHQALRRGGFALALLAALAGAAQASRAPPRAVAQGLAVADEAPWWQGFHDPALDALQRNARAASQGLGVDGPALSARVATLYVMQRWLNSRQIVADGLRRLLARQRQWAALQGPTAEAAQTLAVLDRDDAALQQRQAQWAERSNRVVAELQQLGAWADTPETLLQTSWAVPRFEPGRRAAGIKAWAGEEPGAQALTPLALQLQRLEGSSEELGARLEAALKALAAGQASEREVLQINQALLLQTDTVLQLQAALAMGWVRLLTGR